MHEAVEARFAEGRVVSGQLHDGFCLAFGAVHRSILRGELRQMQSALNRRQAISAIRKTLRAIDLGATIRYEDREEVGARDRGKQLE
jgi:hypothetical protein